MYARVVAVQLKPDKADEAVSLWRDDVLPIAKQQQGFKGVLLSEQNKALAHRFHLEMLQEKKFDLKIMGLDLFRIAGGKIAELWQEADYLGLMQQMGAIPSR